VIWSIRIIGNFVWLGLLAGVLALPLAADEITVTVPPDDPPAQAESAAQPAQAAPQPAASAPLPAFTPNEPLQKSADSSADAAAPTAPAAPVKHKKKAAAVAAPADASASPEAAAATPTATAPAAADGTAKPAQKPKTAKAASPCLNLDENACGGNSLCIWVAAGTNDAGKATKARCRSLALLKKEEAKGKAKAAKETTPEVLPWAANGAAAATPPANGAAAATPAADATKPAKKTKTAAIKKTPKPKPETVEAASPPAASEQDAAPAPASGSVPESDPQ